VLFAEVVAVCCWLLLSSCQCNDLPWYGIAYTCIRANVHLTQTSWLICQQELGQQILFALIMQSSICPAPASHMLTCSS
jgi:hypothetical protein